MDEVDDYVSLPLDAETYERVAARATACDVAVSPWVAATIEAQDTDSMIAESAKCELAAWRSDEAIAYRELGLQLRSSLPTLLLSPGGWRPESFGELVFSNGKPPPFRRNGRGVHARHRGRDVATAARGYWRMRDAGAESRVIVFRRGIPVLHGWVNTPWTLTELENEKGTFVRRRYAPTMYVAEAGHWLDPVTGDQQPMDDEDRAIDRALETLVVKPASNANAVMWLSDLASADEVSE